MGKRKDVNKLAVKNTNNKLSALVIGATLITTVICFKAYEPNAYGIYINGNTVAYVAEKSKAEDMLREITSQVNQRFGNVLENKVSFYKVIASESILASEEELRKGILSAVDSKISAVEMMIDGKTAGIIAGTHEGDVLINRITEHYLSQCDLEDKKVVGLKNRIEYVPTEVNLLSVESWEDIAERIISGDEHSKNPLVTVEITGKVSQELSVEHATIIKWSEAMKQGQSKISVPGEDGLKVVEKQVTLLNGAISSDKIIKETIIKKPQETVIIKGSNAAATASAAVMTMPSRGSVSSNFGMRWGKMHNGIDIAADMGTPIYAALDGIVAFSGWEEGFGNVVKIIHKGNVETIYAHCSVLKVKKDQEVKKGQLIANVGNTGRSTGPHLHFEVRVNGVPQNPIEYLWKKQV